MFKITFNGDGANKALDTLEKQVRFATSVAINRTTQVAREELKKEMRTVFDRPTPFVINSLRTQMSTKKNLEARLWFKNPPRLSDTKHYLEPQVFGGGRPFKRFEHWLQVAGHLPHGWFALPGPAARLDGYGNMSRGQIVQILSALRAMPNIDANRPYKYGLSRGSRAKKNQPVFIVIHPGGKGRPGVWQREGRKIQQVLVFVPKVFYRKRFRFFEVSQRVVEREMKKQFDKALQEAMATAWR